MNTNRRLLSGLLLSGTLLLTVKPAASASERGGEPAGGLPVTGRIKHPGAVRVTGKDTERFKLLRGDTPMQHYPPEAKKAGMDGIVVVDLLLNDQGRVLEAQVVSEAPNGFGFGLAALDTAKTFEFVNPLQKLVLMSVNVEFLP